MNLHVYLVSLLILWRSDIILSDRNTTRAATDKAHVSLPNSVREIIRPTCSKCHDSSLSTAVPAALKIFDVTKDNWNETMSTKHLHSFKDRLTGLNEDDRKIVENFVVEQLLLRQHTSEAQ